MDKTERIKADAEAYANDRFGEYAGNINDFEYPAWKDCADIYIAGATAENEHMRPVIEAAEKVAKIFAHKGDHQTCAICQLAKALEQWKGTGKEQFAGSTLTSPAPGITLGCISPEARELLDMIMEEWEGHYKTVKTDTYEPTFYGFAYWLVRWSGLVQPANTNPTK